MPDGIVWLNYRLTDYAIFFMRNNRKTQSYILVSISLFLVFSYPLLSIANKPAFLLGIPVLYVYVFSAWISGIALLYLAAERSGRKTRDHE